jgi:hypothetical protein
MSMEDQTNALVALVDDIYAKKKIPLDPQGVLTAFESPGFLDPNKPRTQALIQAQYSAAELGRVVMTDIAVGLPFVVLSKGDDVYKILSKLDEVAPNKVIGSLGRNGDLLAKNLGGRIKDHTPHHLIGVAEAEKFDVMKRAAELGYDINRGSNGINLPNKLDLAKELNLPYHPKRGRHRVDTYTGPVDDRLLELQRRYDKGLVNDATLLDEIRKIEDSIHDDLISGKLRLNSRYPWYPKQQ